MPTSATGLVARQPVSLVTISGQPVPALSWDSQHSVTQPIATASFVLPADLPGVVALNAPVAIQGGWMDAGTLRCFSGRIIDIDRDFGDDGPEVKVDCIGYGSLLDFPNERDLVWRGGTFFREIFRSMCKRRGIRRYHADHVTYPAGTPNVKLGGNAYVNGGNVVIEKRRSPLDWLTRTAALFGYRVFETPQDGMRLMRISGKPPTLGTLPFSEGVSFYKISRSVTSEPMVTYWTVRGARYTGANGVQYQVRSTPRSVPYSPELDPPGYRADDISDGQIVTQALADAVRNVAEIDHSEPHETNTWDVDGSPELQPGDIVRLGSPSVGIGPTSLRWLMSVRHSFSDRGFSTTLTGWSGAGRALPAANDCTVVSLGEGPYHLGDESIDWYRVRDPIGWVLDIGFDVPEDYTSLTLRARAHGCNSILVDGKQEDIDVSRVEVHQGGKRVGTGDLPVLGEYYNSRYDYTDDRYWHDIVVPLPGSLDAGRATLRIVSGNEKKGATGAHDDFEAKTLRLSVCGIGAPVLPTTRGR